jgi:integrase
LLKAYAPLAELRLDKVTSENAADFAAQRQGKGLQPSSVNRSLQVLRRVLHMGVEWGVIPSAPKITLLRGERRRERVVTPIEEARYLAAAPDPLCSIATVLADTGLRPEECFRLRWEAITWVNGRHGSLLVTHGKTAAARRVLPMTPRVRMVLETRWDDAGRLEEGWVWPASTSSGHVEPSSLRKQHAKTFRTISLSAIGSEMKPVRSFVLYSLRHTFLTRLGESGCNVWTLARIAGHSSIAMSGRYVHPGDDAVLNALAEMQPKPTLGTSVSLSALPA